MNKTGWKLDNDSFSTGRTSWLINHSDYKMAQSSIQSEEPSFFLWHTPLSFTRSILCGVFYISPNDLTKRGLRTSYGGGVVASFCLSRCLVRRDPLARPSIDWAWLHTNQLFDCFIGLQWRSGNALVFNVDHFVDLPDSMTSRVPYLVRMVADWSNLMK